MKAVSKKRSSTPLQILLVDDDAQVVRYFKKVLEKSGYSVTCVTSGKEALAEIARQQPDLMILDLNMPGTDGFEVLKAERAKFPYLRTMVISGYLQGALLDATKYFGAVAALQKPIAPEALIQKVREVLGR